MEAPKKRMYKVTVHVGDGRRDVIAVSAEDMSIHGGILTLVNYVTELVEDYQNPHGPKKEVGVAKMVAAFAAGAWVMVKEEP
jgi:hypothetical protein